MNLSMPQIDFASGFNFLKKFASQNSTQLLTGTAIAGVGATAYLAAKAGSRAGRHLEYLQSKSEEPLSLEEKVRFTWRFFVPTLGSATLTVSAIVLAQRINERRAAALAGLYALSEKALLDHKNKVEELLGTDKAREVEHRVTQDKINETSGSTEVLILGTEETLIYDTWSGRYFKSSENTIMQTQNSFNNNLMSDNFMTANEFYSMLGLDYIDAGNEVGWTPDFMVDIHIGTHKTVDGKPCLSIEHRYPPRPAIRYLR